MVEIIYDREGFIEFINKFLPLLNPHEAYFIMLFARKKYEIQKYKNNVKHELPLIRKTFRSYNTEISLGERMYNTFSKALWQYFYRKDDDGLYVFKKSNTLFTEKAVSLYYDPNPKDIIKATFKTQSDINTRLKEILINALNSRDADLSKFDNYLKEFKDINKLHISNIHKTNSRVLFFLIDIDTIDEYVLNEALEFLKANRTDIYIHYILRTNGGFHIIIRNADNKEDRKILGKFLYNDFKEFTNRFKLHDKSLIEFKGNDFITPLPYTFHGGIKTELIYPNL